MEKREDLYKPLPNPPLPGEGIIIGIDLYYPWALIFTGRLCDTAGIENPSK